MTDNGRCVHIEVEKSWLIGTVAALVIGLIGQFVGVIWWAGSTGTRLTQIEQKLADFQVQLTTAATTINQQPQIEKRLTGIETQLALAVTERMAAVEKAARLEQQVTDLSGAVRDLSAHVSSVESYLHTQIMERKVK